MAQQRSVCLSAELSGKFTSFGLYLTTIKYTVCLVVCLVSGMLVQNIKKMGVSFARSRCSVFNHRLKRLMLQYLEYCTLTKCHCVFFVNLFWGEKNDCSFWLYYFIISNIFKGGPTWGGNLSTTLICHRSQRDILQCTPNVTDWVDLNNWLSHIYEYIHMSHTTHNTSFIALIDILFTIRLLLCFFYLAWLAFNFTAAAVVGNCLYTC